MLFQRLRFVATGGQSDIIAAGGEVPPLVYTKARLKKGCIRCDIRNSAQEDNNATGTSFVQPKCLALTSEAAVCHRLMFYHQV